MRSGFFNNVFYVKKAGRNVYPEKGYSSVKHTALTISISLLLLKAAGAYCQRWTRIPAHHWTIQTS